MRTPGRAALSTWRSFNPIDQTRKGVDMMQWSDVRFDPAPKILRQFAVTGWLFFWGLAAWRGLGRGEWVLATLLVVSGPVLGLAGLLRPRLIRPVYVAATVAAFPIGWVLSWVMLGLVYYGIFTPLAVIFRVIGRDPLGRRGPNSADTYWKPKPSPRDPTSYLRQY
jgi:Saxitoxin biosynthesis operon protein SxtJ